MSLVDNIRDAQYLIDCLNENQSSSPKFVGGIDPIEDCFNARVEDTSTISEDFTSDFVEADSAFLPNADDALRTRIWEEYIVPCRRISSRLAYDRGSYDMTYEEYDQLIATRTAEAERNELENAYNEMKEELLEVQNYLISRNMRMCEDHFGEI